MKKGSSFIGLILDDDPIIREGIVKSMIDIPQITRLVEAENGQDGLVKTRNQKFDFIVVDMVMPKMGGMEYLRKAIKEEKINKETRILILSGNVEKDFLSEFRDIGVKNILVKPCDIETIKKKIMSLLEITPIV